MVTQFESVLRLANHEGNLLSRAGKDVIISLDGGSSIALAA
jgi:hypothetical protein